MTHKHCVPLIIVILAFLSRISFCQNQEEANNRANAGALKAIGNIPRYGGDSTLDKDEFSSHGQSTYLMGIASLIAIPLVFVALSILLCPIWTLCRCCKCCCCTKKKPKDQITKCQIYGPYFIVFAGVTIIIAMAAIAYGANVDFSGALLYNEGEGEEGNLFSVTEELMEEGVAKVNTIRNITMDIASGVISAVDGVENILNDTSILSIGSSTLISMLYGISDLWNNYSIRATSGGYTFNYPCQFCMEFSSTVQNITNQIDMQIGPIFADLNSTVNEIGSALIDTESEILEHIDDFIEEITSVRDDLSDSEGEVIDKRADIENYNDIRELAYNIIFAIPLLPIIFILFGGILKKPICFTLSYICLWFSCTLMWLLLAIHLPIAVLLNDTCNFLDIIDSDVTATFNNTAGQIFEACLNNEKLTETLGLGASLNFTNTITFPTLGNISDDFQFDALLSFEDDALNTNFTTFYGEGDIALNGVNNLTFYSPHSLNNPWYFNRDNISLLNSTEFYPFNSTPQISLESLKQYLVLESSLIDRFNQSIYKINANLSSVQNQVNMIENGVQELVNGVNNASILLDPLFNSVDDMIDTARCGFIGDAYKDTKAVMCSSVLGSLSRIVVSMFVIAILSLFSCLWTVKLVRKVEWWQVQKREEKEKKLQQSFPTNQPNTIVVMQPNPAISNNGYQPGMGNMGNMGNMPNGMYYNPPNV